MDVSFVVIEERNSHKDHEKLLQLGSIRMASTSRNKLKRGTRYAATTGAGIPYKVKSVFRLNLTYNPARIIEFSEIGHKQKGACCHNLVGGPSLVTITCASARWWFVFKCLFINGNVFSTHAFGGQGQCK